MKNRLISIKTVNITGWILYFILLLIFFSNILSFDKALYRSLELITVEAAVFYFNALFLMPRLLEKQKLSWYFVAVVSLMLFAALAVYFIDFHWKPFGDIVYKGRGAYRMINQGPGGPINPFHGTPDKVIIWRAVLRNTLSIFAIILISIVSRMFYQKQKEEKKKAELRNENLISEMKFLKSQVNPHFLFNALNNIYTLVLLKHESATTMLMKLSEMLRYMLYECNDDLVPLEKEIAYINNYIELQQLKTEQPQNISTIFNIENNKAMIPPLLLIPFIENSFKHSRIIDAENGRVRIKLSSTEKMIHFEISNSIPAVPIAKDKIKGIGLENVRRRLDLLYPGSYELNISETKSAFNVELNIFNES